MVHDFQTGRKAEKGSEPINGDDFNTEKQGKGL